MPALSDTSEATAAPVLSRTADVGLLSLAAGGWSQALVFLEQLVKRGKGHYVCFCEANLLSSMIHDEEVAAAVNAADAVFPDGVALMILAKIQGHKVKERVSGPTFLIRACEYGISKQWRHFFYGGAPGVADRVARNLAQRYPGLIVAGTHSPPFRALTAQEQEADQAMIRAARPDLLWICLGSPKQELWCAKYARNLPVPVVLPVGAAFDFHSGHKHWAPNWVRKTGTEWIFRSLTGGRHTFLRNMRCVSTVALLLATTLLRRILGRSVTGGRNRLPCSS